jgi:hypothetical protein
MDETNSLLRDILAAVLQQQTVAKVAKDLPSEGKRDTIPVATPSKLELATQWLKEHREDRKKSGRTLSATVRPMGVEISRTYWDKAKKQLRS